jgi:hypothetical protein
MVLFLSGCLNIKKKFPAWKACTQISVTSKSLLFLTREIVNVTKCVWQEVWLLLLYTYVVCFQIIWCQPKFTKILISKQMFLLFSIFSTLYKTGGIYELLHGCPATFRYQKPSKQLTGLSKFHANGCLPTDICSLLSVPLQYWWRQIVRWDKYELLIINNINFINSAVNVTMLSNLNHTCFDP